MCIRIRGREDEGGREEGDGRGKRERRTERAGKRGKRRKRKGSEQSRAEEKRGRAESETLKINEKNQSSELCESEFVSPSYL